VRSDSSGGLALAIVTVGPVVEKTVQPFVAFAAVLLQKKWKLIATQRGITRLKNDEPVTFYVQVFLVHSPPKWKKKRAPKARA